VDVRDVGVHALIDGEPPLLKELIVAGKNLWNIVDIDMTFETSQPPIS
jgi:hypothetical protein